MTIPENLLSEWASILMCTFADAGVRDIVMSPGSRSTPFVAAAVRESRLRLHDIIDERAASFFALGQARASGLPSVLLCTSGTAGAHYFPAAIEANASGLPLIVVTADRPHDLMDCGASQTIDQTKLFGEHARKFIDLGAPSDAVASLRSLRRMVVQSVVATRYPLPGVVHINARADKPLEPKLQVTSEPAKALAVAAAAVRARPVPRVSLPRKLPDATALDEVLELCAKKERGLIVCGPAPVDFANAREAVFAFAAKTGFPLFCELPSQLRLSPVPEGVVLCDGFDTILRSKAFTQAHTPDLIIQIGSTPTSSGWENYSAAKCDAARAIISDGAWLDPTSSASHILFGDVSAILSSLAARAAGRGAVTAWAKAFAGAAKLCAGSIDEVLAATEGLNEGACARAVVESLPTGSALMLGNSLAIRTADAFARRTGADIAVFCQRGANGIDGNVAGSCGTAKTLRRPFTLYIGDVSLLHDLSSLMLARDMEQPFVVVVVQNQGGRIFEQLPLGRGPSDGDAELRALYQRTLGHVTTPHPIHFEHAASLFGHAYARVTTEPALRAALGEAHKKPGCTLIEVIVPESGAAEQYRRLWDSVSAKLAR